MSMNDVAKFFHRVHGDEALQKAMRGTLPDGHPKTEEEVAREIVRIAQTAGFTFSIEEYRESLHQEVTDGGDDGVSEEMIDKIQRAAGRCAWNSIITSKTSSGGSFFSG